MLILGKNQFYSDVRHIVVMKDNDHFDFAL